MIILWMKRRMKKLSKQERVEVINKLIKFISERGRRFFWTKRTLNDETENTAYVKLKNGRVYFVDNYTKQEIPVINNYRDWKGFSHGGTLRSLVLEFAEFIRKGNSSNGEHGCGGLYCDHWGHEWSIQQEIINYAKEIGYLKG